MADRHGRGSAGGFVTPAFVVTVGFTLLLLVAVANLVAVHYARGVMQAAVEEGARQGAAVGAPQACTARADAMIASLGSMADGIGLVECTLEPGESRATMAATFPPWLPLAPAHAVEVHARVVQPTAGS